MGGLGCRQRTDSSSPRRRRGLLRGSERERERERESEREGALLGTIHTGGPVSE
jgi:hypothetical protein